MINLFFVIHDYSGARTYAYELLCFLRSTEEMDIHLLFLRSRYYKEYILFKQNGITEIHFPDSLLKNIEVDKYACRCVDLFQPFIKDKRNLVFHFNDNSQVFFAQKVRERFDANLIYTLHFLYNNFSYFASEKQKPVGWVTTGDVLEKQIIRYVDHVICVTNFAKESIHKWYEIPNDKVTVIHNGYSETFDQIGLSIKQKEEIRNKLGFYDDEQIMLFVGVLEKRKGIKHLLNVFNRLVIRFPKVRLVIAGDGDFNEVLKYSKGCYGKVSLTGRIPSTEVKQMYQIADFGVIPSVFEQCSFVALEMMQYGLPVVVSDVPGLNELYVDHENALLVPLIKSDNELLELEVIEEELEKSIISLLSDIKLRNKIGKSAYKHWKDGYTAKYMSNETLKIYRHVLKKNKFT